MDVPSLSNVAAFYDGKSAREHEVTLTESVSAPNRGNFGNNGIQDFYTNNTPSNNTVGIISDVAGRAEELKSGQGIIDSAYDKRAANIQGTNSDRIHASETERSKTTLEHLGNRARNAFTGENDYQGHAQTPHYHPDGTLHGVENSSNDLKGKIRDEPLSPDFKKKLSNSVSSLGPEYDVKVISGGQMPLSEAQRLGATKDSKGTWWLDGEAVRTGSTRHDVGMHGESNTADIILTRNGQEIRPADDPQLYSRFIEKAAEDFPGIGHYSWGVHVGGGSESFWGPDTRASSADPNFAAAFQRGRTKS